MLNFFVQVLRGLKAWVKIIPRVLRVPKGLKYLIPKVAKKFQNRVQIPVMYPRCQNNYFLIEVPPKGLKDPFPKKHKFNLYFKDEPNIVSHR